MLYIINYFYFVDILCKEWRCRDVPLPRDPASGAGSQSPVQQGRRR
jgi:hypothetical protein